MTLTARTAGFGVLALLAVPAVALAALPRGGTFTSTKADIHVAKGGARIRDAEINCKQRNGGLTLQSVEFGTTPIRVEPSGAFAYHGTVVYGYFTGSGYKSRLTTASLKGRFDSSTRVHGSVTGGPRACASVSFTATYNPRAH